MADIVVPQEYGTTIAEKRSVGVKICHGLLEKIKYDLSIARQDNQVDMRYLINLAYQSDLNINTLGRRIRTRLYFTSESHLHTVLSVLRFGCEDDRRLLLSEHGLSVINNAPELCYLTQIVLRVFEDARHPMDNPGRFRVEILFSPGANSTPFHMHEKERDQDTSRFDTAPLQLISREDLTCQDVEDFFDRAIMAAGRLSGDEDEVASTSTTAERIQGTKHREGQLESKLSGSNLQSEDEGNHAEPVTPLVTNRNHEHVYVSVPVPSGTILPVLPDEPHLERADTMTHTNRTRDRSATIVTDNTSKCGSSIASHEDGEDNGSIDRLSLDSTDDRNNDPKKQPRGAHYMYWSAIAVGTFVLGVSCLLGAVRMSRRAAK